MKIEMILVYVFVAALVIVPYFALIVFGSGKSKKNSKYFNDEVKRNNLNINEKEGWNRHILGLDKSNNKLLFVQFHENETSSEIIDLSKVSTIGLVYEKTFTKVEGKRLEILERSGLEFHFADNSSQRILFYESGADVAQNYEYEHVVKWRDMILASIPHKAVTIKSTAA